MNLELLNTDKEIFNGPRFINLCRHYIGKEFKEYFYLWCKITFIFLICGFLFNFLLGSIRIYHNGTVLNFTSFDFLFKIILYISIIAKAVNAFSEYRNKETAIAWMLLPGSVLEKILSRILFSFFGLIVLIYISYFLGLNLGTFLSYLLFDHAFTFYFPLTSGANFYFDPARTLILYFVTILNLHAIFFAGGIYFKKHSFIKTCLAVAVISLCLTVVFSSFGGLTYAFRSTTSGDTYYLTNRYWPIFAERTVKLVFYCIVPIFCWTISFYKLKERQVI